MQLLLDFLPILAFFIAYKLRGIYVATAILMVAMPIQCLLVWILKRKINTSLGVFTNLRCGIRITRIDRKRRT